MAFGSGASVVVCVTLVPGAPLARLQDEVNQSVVFPSSNKIGGKVASNLQQQAILALSERRQPR